MNHDTAKKIDDLLLRSGLFDEKTINKSSETTFDFSDEVILITGAAGSIGSQLGRQLISSSFKQLILIDVAESPLYNLIKDLEHHDNSNILYYILNINEFDKVEALIKNFKPTIIFHAAAYKHVPLMETDPIEAVNLNILATKNLVDLAVQYQVSKFTFISTDKAVNPNGIMSLTKLISETYISNYSSNSGVSFFITRFGNVLGSNGSVVPIFKKQIESNKPLTITNKAVSRYFIDKTLACQLILDITFNHDQSNTFTFKMGEPLKIVDIASRILAIYSKSLEDYNIKYTGLRAGEKLEETILNPGENLTATKNKNVFIVDKPSKQFKAIDFSKLEKLDPFMSPLEANKLLKSLL